MTKNKKPRVAFYLRVSTDEQTTANQRRDLARVAKASGWQVVEVYEDAGISGANGREKRPALDKMLKDATARKFDLVAAWSVDRLGRSLRHLVAFLEELHALKIDLYLHVQGIDTTTPTGQMMFQMLAVFAEFERSMIVERVNAGIARAKARGVQLGRRKLPMRVQREVLERRDKGQTVRSTAKDMRISPDTVQKVRSGQY